MSTKNTSPIYINTQIRTCQFIAIFYLLLFSMKSINIKMQFTVMGEITDLFAASLRCLVIFM
jgi:hypothetical protein